MFGLLSADSIKKLPRARFVAAGFGGAAFCPRCGKALLQSLPGGGGVVVWCRNCKGHVHCPAVTP